MNLDLALTKKPLTWARIVLLGGISGAAMDQIHVRFHVLSYASPVLGGQSWWVAPNFGLATCVIYVLTSLWAPQAERARPAAPTDTEIAALALWFVDAYAASAALQDFPATLAALYGVLFGVRLLGRKDAAAQLGLGASLALGGCAAEGLLAATGVFHYERPQLWTVPLWLPGIYVHGAPLAMGIVRRMRGLAARPRQS